MSQDDRPVQTHRGTRPGSSWADLLFSFVVQKILNRRDEILAATQPDLMTEVWVPSDESRSLSLGERSTWMKLSDLIWADDIATMRSTSNAARLPPAAKLVVGASCDSFSEHGFRLSFGRNKTAVLAQPAGAGSKQSRRLLYGAQGMKGTLTAMRENDVPVALPLVSEYRHLGVQISVQGKMGPEIAYRISQSRAAFQEGRRKVFKATSIPVARKAYLLRAYVLPKLLFGSGSWPPLSKAEQRMFNGALWSYYRQILCVPRDSDQHYSFATVLALVNLPGPDATLHAQRLLYLGQMVRTGPPELWALVKLDRPYADLVLASARWLFQWVHRTSPLPNPETGWPTWLSLMQNEPHKMKGWVARAQALEAKRCQVVASLDGLYRALRSFTEPASTASQEVDKAGEVCIPCGRLFRTRVAWSCHAQRVHGYRSRPHTSHYEAD